jgi:hypothetical protein
VWARALEGVAEGGRGQPLAARRVVEFCPTWVELRVTAGIRTLGLFVLSVLVRVAQPIGVAHLGSRTVCFTTTRILLPFSRAHN